MTETIFLILAYRELELVPKISYFAIFAKIAQNMLFHLQKKTIKLICDHDANFPSNTIRHNYNEIKFRRILIFQTSYIY